MYSIIRTNSENIDFHNLIVDLDKELAIRDGEDHAFYSQFNNIDKIKYVVLIYQNGAAIACGSIKEYEKDIMEVKRMYVPLAHRGKGIASIVLQELEKWAKELGYKKCILETGFNQPEAIRLYKKNNYIVISNYGQYYGINSSICFKKDLINL